MKIQHNLYDLQLRVDALELLLISRGKTNRENLEVFRLEATQNYLKAQDEFLQKQWAMIKLGSVVKLEVYPTSRLVLEVINISPEPFQYLAGKIVEKHGKSGYRVGEIFTIKSPWKIELQTGIGASEIISRD